MDPSQPRNACKIPVHGPFLFFGRICPEKKRKKSERRSGRIGDLPCRSLALSSVSAQRSAGTASAGQTRTCGWLGEGKGTEACAPGPCAHAVSRFRSGRVALSLPLSCVARLGTKAVTVHARPPLLGARLPSRRCSLNGTRRKND
jgi:hypothetical protein